MFRLNLLNNCIKKNQLLILFNQQQRDLREQIKFKNELKNELKRSSSFNQLDKRYTRTKIGCVLVNRIYLRIQKCSKQLNLTDLSITNNLVKEIRRKSFTKYHNLVIFNELNDKTIKNYLNKQRKSILKKSKRSPSMSKLIYLFQVKGKKRGQIEISNGINFDENGKPYYGKWRNSMFLHFNNPKLASRNLYRLLDSKLNNPKFCIDFYPCRLVRKGVKNLTLSNLIYLFKHNFLSCNPFNLYFTNYQHDYDQILRNILYQRNLPSFVDLKFDETAYDELSSENQKLIIIIKDAAKPIYFDYQANYLLPLFMGRKSRAIIESQKYYVERFLNRPNVEFVYVPLDFDKKVNVNFQFTYYLLYYLKKGLNIEESFGNAKQHLKR